ncbi:MAG: preprotein translocase subunit YajC [Methyloligellaceae bacterium]
MFITPAFAQGAPGGSGDFLVTLLPFILIFAIMYFLIIRPQQKRLKDHREMVAAVRRGDTIVTSGGIVGKITKVIDDNELQVEISEGVRVKLVKSTISEVRAKGEPVKESAAS